MSPWISCIHWHIPLRPHCVEAALTSHCHPRWVSQPVQYFFFIVPVMKSSNYPSGRYSFYFSETAIVSPGKSSLPVGIRPVTQQNLRFGTGSTNTTSGWLNVMMRGDTSVSPALFLDIGDTVTCVKYRDIPVYCILEVRVSGFQCVVPQLVALMIL